MAKKKKTNPRKKVLTEADAKAIIKEAMGVATHDISIIAICVSAMCAHDVYGFGPQRIERLISDMLKKFRDWDEGLYTADDAAQWLKDYAGISIEDRDLIGRAAR